MKEYGQAAQENIQLEILTTSVSELVIAPGRHFKVSGSLSGEIPDDAALKVSLLDSSDKEIRFAATDQKGTDRVTSSWYQGDITIFDKDTDFSEIAYTAPELAVADPSDPESSAHNATVKCVYTDETFYALITSAADPEHGLAEEDGYDLTDQNGAPYDALPPGDYTVLAELTSADGQRLASASEEIEIGRKDGTVIHEITNKTAIEKGGMDLLSAWAEAENLTILGDLFPGMFGPYYQMSTMPLAVSCETAEYLPGRIVAFDKDETMRVCRIDSVKDETKDGIFLTTEAQVLESDLDPSDGWTSASDSAFAVAGVMKPYQLRDSERIPDGEIYGYYQFLNSADTLKYIFTPSDGSDTFSITKPSGVSRIDEPGDESAPAVYEFYNVFPAGTLRSGVDYDVAVQAYDRKGAQIKNMALRFKVTAE